MIYVKKYFIFTPGGENESSNSSTDKKNKEQEKGKPNPEDEQKEHIPLLKKIKEALQDWSNGDQRDLEYDDTRV